MQVLLSLLKSILLIYFAVVLLMAVFQDKLIFIPQSINNPYAVQFENYRIQFTHKENRLEGWFIGKDLISATNPLIVYYGGNAEEVSGNLLDLQNFPTFSFLFMNYRGFGESKGKPSQEVLVNDAVFILNHLIENEAINPSHIILMGRSLGSGIAVQVAHQIKVKALILVTPFDSLTNVVKNHYPFLPVKLLIKHPFDSISLSPFIDTPALFLMGTEDQIIDNNRTQAIYNVWKGPSDLAIIKGAGHNDIQKFPLYWQKIKDFIDSSKKTAKTSHH